MIKNIWKDRRHEFYDLIRGMQVKHRNQYRLLGNLKGDVESSYSNRQKIFGFSLAVTWSTIWYKQAVGTPVILFRQYGRFLKTHRTFRLYGYSFLALHTALFAPLNRQIEATMMNIRDTDRIRNSVRYNNFEVTASQETDQNNTVMPWQMRT